MNYINEYLSEAFVQAMGWTILHSLWQGAIVALLLGTSMVVMNKHSANARYFLSSAALILIVFLTGITFYIHYDASRVHDGFSTNAQSGIENTQSIQITTETTFKEISTPILGLFKEYFVKHLPLIVTFWLLGFLVISLRLLGGLAFTQRMRHYRVYETAKNWQVKVNDQCVKLGIGLKVKVLESALAKVPMVIGHLKPIILFPIGTISGLSVEQVEAILAHELAHVYRNDYLMNIIQSIIETIFFYHPAVWWISSTIRTEREHCCDDIAVALNQDSITFAKALANLEEINWSPQLAMAITGRKGKLYNRINRLLYAPKNNSTFKEGFIAACILISGIFLMSFNSTFSESELLLKPIKDVNDYSFSSKSDVVQAITDDKGEIIQTYLNGKIVDDPELASTFVSKKPKVDQIDNQLNGTDGQSEIHPDEQNNLIIEQGENDEKVLSTVLDDGTYLFVRFDKNKNIKELFVNGKEVSGKERAKYEKIALNSLEKLESQEENLVAQEELMRVQEKKMRQLLEESEQKMRQAEKMMLSEENAVLENHQKALKLEQELFEKMQKEGTEQQLKMEFEMQSIQANLQRQMEKEMLTQEEKMQREEIMARNHEEMRMKYERESIHLMEEMQMKMEQLMTGQESKLKKELINDNLIKSDKESLEIKWEDDNTIYINGKRLKGKIYEKYHEILRINNQEKKDMEKQIKNAMDNFHKKRALDDLDFRMKMNKKVVE